VIYRASRCNRTVHSARERGLSSFTLHHSIVVSLHCLWIIVAETYGATRMLDPIRVVVVEHRQQLAGSRNQLLAQYELDFSWQCVESLLELNQSAADFDPNIVLCEPCSTRRCLFARPQDGWTVHHERR
jgi:hypothetical protein